MRALKRFRRQQIYGEKSMKKTRVYEIKRFSIQRGENTTGNHRENHRRRKVRTPDFVVKITSEIDNDRRMTIRKLATAMCGAFRLSMNTLHEDLDRTKKSPGGFLAAVRRRGYGPVKSFWAWFATALWPHWTIHHR
jgi:hypothetical protein